MGKVKDYYFNDDEEEFLHIDKIPKKTKKVKHKKDSIRLKREEKQRRQEEEI